MFTPTSLLNDTANTKDFTQPLVNKGNGADDECNHQMNFNIPLNPSWNTVCDSVMPATCYLHE